MGGCELADLSRGERWALLFDVMINSVEARKEWQRVEGFRLLLLLPHHPDRQKLYIEKIETTTG